ncbi:unnamed protein product [Phytomonas sp. EM1]|nr:unnamed protein product [Phytomonas sp. EM1]|eukprot:CCW61150.1 unnamed protein product [Phytomonas sp. isolate EM1]
MADYRNRLVEPCAAKCIKHPSSSSEGPDPSDSFNYLMWRRALLHRFPPNPTTTVHPESGDASPTHEEDPLTPIGKALRLALEEQFSPNAGEVLRRCRDEPFPIPHGEATEMRALLQTIEVAARLAMGRPNDNALANLIAGLRQQFKLLCAKKVVELRAGKFPGLVVVVELSAFQVILRRWEEADLGSRRTAIQSAVNICQLIQSEASECCRKALTAALNDPQTLNVESTQQQIRDVVASVPFEFPDACRMALSSIRAADAEPDGKLWLPSVESSEARKDAITLDSSTDSEDDPRTVADMVLRVD